MAPRLITNPRDALLGAADHLRQVLAECKDPDEMREIVEAIVGIEAMITRRDLLKAWDGVRR